jgi:hypothetical protein
MYISFLNDFFYKDKLNNLKFDFKKQNCNYYIKKNGEILYNPYELDNIICLFKQNIFYSQIYGDIIILKNKNIIIKNLLIIAYIQKHSNLKYFKLRDNSIIIFNEEKIKSFDNFLNIIYIIENNLDNLYKKNDILNVLCLEFYYYRNCYYKKISDKKIIVYLFYMFYIYLIENEIQEKYNINIKIEFSNYKELYIFLKKKGYVKKYYNYYYNYILTNYINVYDSYVKKNKNKLIKNRIKMVKKIEYFNNIDLKYIIDNEIPLNIDKQYIKNKFIELKKKYNI